MDLPYIIAVLIFTLTKTVQDFNLSTLALFHDLIVITLKKPIIS